MAALYSFDLRKRVVAAVTADMSRAAVAKANGLVS